MKQAITHRYTKEGEALAADSTRIPFCTYPRPHLERDSFYCLNGYWDFAVCPDGIAPEYKEKIRVPFVPQSLLSEVCKAPKRGERLCYHRTFSLPEGFVRKRVLLHFGGVDCKAQVWLNGKLLGEHIGAYDGFCFDISTALREENELSVFVCDRGDYTYPWGKQRHRRGGMWYTPVSGIWQTVWVESVPQCYVTELQITPRLDGALLKVACSEPSFSGTVTLHLEQGDVCLALEAGCVDIKPEHPVLWTPDTPHLYRITLHVGEDTVRSYFALRTLEVRESDGVPRLCLNGVPYFFHGLLDQGYYSDGIFTPAGAECYEQDILAAKALGFNMLRKHIKVEPDCFYYACDRLGMVVFQDMVNNGRYSFLRDTALPTLGLRRRNDRYLHRNAKTRAAFWECATRTVQRLQMHPCICAWTVFNEGWGQFDQAGAYRKMKEMDATRFVDTVSGWFLPPKRCEFYSDMDSPHVYFKPIALPPPQKRPVLLSEFGGYSYKIPAHAFHQTKNYGYRTFRDQEAFQEALLALYRNEVLPAARAGLSGAVYTQLCDVEDETNGLLTYDRRVCKVEQGAMQTLAAELASAWRSR